MKKKIYSSPDLELVKLDFEHVMMNQVRDSYPENYSDDIDDRD